MKIELSQGSLPNEDKIALVTNLVAGYFENQKHISEKVKGEIMITRDAVLENITKPEFNDISTVDLMSLSIPDDQVRKDLPAFVRTFLEKVNNLQEKNQLFIAKEGDKIVGMCGYKHVGTNPDNKLPVYEISHLSVLPDAEGHGLGKKIKLTIYKHLFKNYGNCDALTFSVNPKVQRGTEAMEVEEITPLMTKTFMDQVPVAERSDKEKAWSDRQIEKGAKFYLMHLNEKKVEELTTGTDDVQ